MSLIAIRADVAANLAAYRADQAKPPEDRRPVAKPTEHDQARGLRGIVTYGDPLVLIDGTTDWWCYDDDRWPATPPVNDDGTVRDQTGAIRVFPGVPEGWAPVDAAG
jgi:hypothetical protein